MKYIKKIVLLLTKLIGIIISNNLIDNQDKPIYIKEFNINGYRIRLVGYKRIKPHYFTPYGLRCTELLSSYILNLQRNNKRYLIPYGLRN